VEFITNRWLMREQSAVRPTGVTRCVLFVDDSLFARASVPRARDGNPIESMS
jgi:hypothetical protein